MARFDDARFATRLAEVNERAGPFLDGAAAPPAAGPAIVALRIALLQRVAESDLAAADSADARLHRTLARRAGLTSAEDIALELALCHFALDLGFGVALSWRRLPLLDPVLDDLERAPADAAISGQAARLIDLLANETISLDAGAAQRRLRLVAWLARRQPELSALAFDPADDFGRLMRDIGDGDERLAAGIGILVRLAVDASKPLPSPTQRRAIAAISADSTTAELARDAVRRASRQLLLAPLAVRGPGLSTVRPSNQRLGRAILWLIGELDPVAGADLLGRLGTRLATSDRRDNQSRDVGLANSCVALLGQLGHTQAIAALGEMRERVRNRPVRKQIDKALEALARERQVGMDEMLGAALPAYGIGATGRRVVPVGDWQAIVQVAPGGKVLVGWQSSAAEHAAALAHQPPMALREAHPAEVQGVADLAQQIHAALRDERTRLERMLLLGPRMPLARWQRDYLDHPLRSIHAKRLIWRVVDGERSIDVLPVDGQLLSVAGAPVVTPATAAVGLWHPVEDSDAALEAWRDVIVARRIVQPFRQAFRETYRAAADWTLSDLRFAGRPLAYAQFRALLGVRGWSAPQLGPYDQGDRAIATRDFPEASLRAEFEHVAAGLGSVSERVAYVRSGAVRFVRLDVDQRPVLLAEVPPRILSEALRDVDLFSAVPDPTRRPASEAQATPAVVARTAALRRIMPGLSMAAYASLFGIWLRVETGAGAWLVSLVDARVLELPAESEIEIELPPTGNAAEAGAYLPSADDPVLERALRIAEHLISSGLPGS